MQMLYVKYKQTSDNQLSYIIEMHRHIEDLDNRGILHNIRVGGVLENIDQPNLEHSIATIFNKLLK